MNCSATRLLFIFFIAGNISLLAANVDSVNTGSILRDCVELDKTFVGLEKESVVYINNFKKNWDVAISSKPSECGRLKKIQYLLQFMFNGSDLTPKI